MKLEDFVPIDHLSADDYAMFMDRRGGCSCCVSPPCHACCDPITEEELEYFDIEVDEE